MTTFLFLRYNQYFSSLVLAKRAVGKISIHFISFCGKQLQINILTKETLKQRIPCWCHIPYLRLISDLLPFPLKISHQALPTSSHQACLSSWQSHILLKIQSILGFLYHKQYFSLMFLRILTAGFLKNFSSSHPTSSLPFEIVPLLVCLTYIFNVIKFPWFSTCCNIISKSKQKLWLHEWSLTMKLTKGHMVRKGIPLPTEEYPILSV